MAYTEHNIDLPYGSPQHARLKTRLQEMLRMSRQKMSERWDKWRKAEDLFLAYAPKSDEDTVRERKRDQEGKKTYSTITIPYSYATLLTAHTYWSSVFLGRNPVNQFTARHGEGHQMVQALEAVVDYQVQVGEMLVPYYVWLLDAGKYGLGVVSCYWCEDQTMIARYVEQPRTFMGVPIPGKVQKVRQEELVTSYAGNKLANVRPYDFRPDPRVSITNWQKGEFCGHVAYPSWNDLLRSNRFINREAVQKLRDGGLHEREQGSGQVSLPDIGVETMFDHRSLGKADKPSNVEAFQCVWELVPSEWDLAESNVLEKWVFTLAANEVIIEAKPLGCFHNKYPYGVLVYEVDGYSHQTRGMLEIIKPLNDTIDWLFNSHFYNTRKILNDMLVVDPQRIVLKDLLDNGPGKIIRLHPSAYGTDARTAIHQLPVQDVTRLHLQDAQIVMELIQRVTGVSDNLMGLLDPGGRKTATEVRTSSNFGINRLKTVTEFMSAFGFAPLAQMIVQNTQQYYDAEKQFKIVGDLMMGAPKYQQVTPEQIQGFYDFVPVDGTMPVDRFAQANLWKEVLMGMNQMPQLAMQYDMGAIFQWMAQLAGLKNITQFKLQVAPDAQVMDMAAGGKVVPIGGGQQQPRIPGNAATSAAGVGAVPK